MKVKISFIVLLSVVSFGIKLSAQTATVTKVTFNNNNLKMAGNLYVPKDFNENKKYPVLIYDIPKYINQVTESMTAFFEKK
jgi:predicted alpha/beta superfamily hydrolase